MRTDKAKNIKALKNELLKNPLQTEEEIAEKLWVHRVTVNRLKEEMHEIVTNSKNDDIIAITDNDKKIIEDAQFINMFTLWWIRKQIETWEITKVELRDAKQVSEIAKESTARYSIFKWDITNSEWWLKQPDIIFQIINPNGEENN